MEHQVERQGLLSVCVLKYILYCMPGFLNALDAFLIDVFGRGDRKNHGPSLSRMVECCVVGQWYSGVSAIDGGA